MKCLCVATQLLNWQQDEFAAVTSISPVPTRDVCVVIPALNHEKLIGRCIQSVLDGGLQPDQITRQAQHQLTEARGRLQPPSNPFAVHHSTTIQGAKRWNQ